MLIFCGIPLLLALMNVLFQLVITVRIKKLADELRMRCFERLLHQPMSFFDETHSAELTQKCSQEAMNYITIETLDKPRCGRTCAYAPRCYACSGASIHGWPWGSCCTFRSFVR